MSEKLEFQGDFIEKMHALLLDEKKKLEHELNEIANLDPNNPGSATPKFPDMGSGEDENAAEVAAYGDNIAVTEELRSALKDVLSGLSNIEKGTYGICKYCHAPIDERRLLARPASTSCITCKKQRTQEL